MKRNLKELQEKNCRGCRFANQEKVGTGEPCCTYPGTYPCSRANPNANPGASTNTAGGTTDT